MIDQFFRALFDEGEATNFCNELWDSKSIAFCHVSRPTTERFCLNPLDPRVDHKPTDPAKHRADLPRRADHNVVAFRNILIESDSASIEDQIKWLNSSFLPYTAVVFSGKKSLHIIISLESPLPEKKYKKLVKKLYEAVKYQGLSIDDTGKNPSRLTRYPGTVRADNRAAQTLLTLKSRVTLGQIKSWLKGRLPPERKAARKNKIIQQVKLHERFISRTTRALVEQGQLSETSRHACFLKAASQMRKSGFEMDEIEAYLQDACLEMIPERPQELYGILNWVSYNVVPEIED